MKKLNLVYYIALITQVGLTIIFSILVGLGIGLFLDRLFKTRSIFLVIFLTIGILGGAYTVYKEIMKGVR